MKARGILLAATLTVGGFVGGFGYGRWYGPKAAAVSPSKTERTVLYYVDPMHPAYRSDKPGVAPDCGMKLEPVYADENATDSKALESSSKTSGGAAKAMPPGTVHIPEEKQQLIGVHFGTAEYTENAETLRAAGKVAIDETRLVHVHSKVDGWIERVQVDFNGAFVRKGQPLLTLYSPDMLTTEKEYLLSLKARDVLKGSQVPTVAESSESLAQAARKRLELWDLSESQLEQIERTGAPIHSITLNSPAQGFVASRNSFPNQRVTPETELYTLGDLSRVWIVADLFEADLPKVSTGQQASISVPGQRGAAFQARVSYIQPELDPQTRTVKLRLDAPNPGLRLKPSMFVDVLLRLSSKRALTVPGDAVLDSGERQTVFVDRGGGYLEPRAVAIGDHMGDRVAVLQGLRAGERVVTSAAFLVDSESQLKAAMGRMTGAEKPEPQHGETHD